MRPAFGYFNSTPSEATEVDYQIDCAKLDGTLSGSGTPSPAGSPDEGACTTATPTSDALRSLDAAGPLPDGTPYLALPVAACGWCEKDYPVDQLAQIQFRGEVRATCVHCIDSRIVAWLREDQR